MFLLPNHPASNRKRFRCNTIYCGNSANIVRLRASVLHAHLSQKYCSPMLSPRKNLFTPPAMDDKKPGGWQSWSSLATIIHSLYTSAQANNVWWHWYIIYIIRYNDLHLVSVPQIIISLRGVIMIRFCPVYLLHIGISFFAQKQMIRNLWSTHQRMGQSESELRGVK